MSVDNILVSFSYIICLWLLIFFCTNTLCAQSLFCSAQLYCRKFLNILDWVALLATDPSRWNSTTRQNIWIPHSGLPRSVINYLVQKEFKYTSIEHHGAQSTKQKTDSFQWNTLEIIRKNCMKGSAKETFAWFLDFLMETVFFLRPWEQVLGPGLIKLNVVSALWLVKCCYTRCTHCSHSVQCTVYIVQCTVYSLQCTVYSVQCTVYSVWCTVYSVQCIVYSVQCTVYSVQWTVYSVQCTVYNVQSTLYSAVTNSAHTVHFIVLYTVCSVKCCYAQCTHCSHSSLIF